MTPEEAVRVLRRLSDGIVERTPEAREALSTIEATLKRLADERDGWRDGGFAAIRRGDELEATLARYREALSNLLNKLDELEPAINAVFVMAHVHGSSYEGGTWLPEYTAARAALDLKDPA